MGTSSVNIWVKGQMRWRCVRTVTLHTRILDLQLFVFNSSDSEVMRCMGTSAQSKPQFGCFGHVPFLSNVPLLLRSRFIFISVKPFSTVLPTVLEYPTVCSWLGGGLDLGLLVMDPSCSGQCCPSWLKVLLGHPHVLKSWSSAIPSSQTPVSCFFPNWCLPASSRHTSWFGPA